MLKIKNIEDFHSIFIDEGSPFYDTLVKIDKNKLNNWVLENFEKYGEITSFNEVLPPRSLINKSVESGYIHHPSQCHFSARTICLLNEDIDYITGFIHRPSDPLMPIITHSFNLRGSQIIDFARLDENFQVIEENDTYLPHRYYGIKIPKSFILSVNYEEPMTPLLYEWISTKLLSNKI